MATFWKPGLSCSKLRNSFHLIVHGPREDNSRLYALKDSYPITIEDVYEKHLTATKSEGVSILCSPKCAGGGSCLSTVTNSWNFRTGQSTQQVECFNLSEGALFAPMLQRLTIDGSLDTPTVVKNTLDVSIVLHRSL